jgi:beta-lactamase regulating signal transducer with metallopeptidase domain
MTTSQQLVIYWMEFALAGTIVLGVTKVVVHRLRQPIDRVNMIFMSVVACVFVPLILSSLSTPGLQLGLFSKDGNQQERVEAIRHIPQPRPHLGDADVSTFQSERQANVEALASEPRIRSKASPVVNGVREVELPARSNESSSSGMIDQPTVWSFIAAILLASHGMVVSWCLVQWIIGTLRLHNLSKRAVGADQSILDLWNEVSGSGDRSVRLLVSDEICTPMFFGCWNPVILLPPSISAGDPSSLRFCLAHEWSHVRCRDLVKWQLISLCQLGLWYQPLFWSLRRELRLCQDLVADDHAAGEAESQLARIEYSELLLSIAKGTSNPAIAGGMAFFDRSSQLMRRVKMLLTNGPSLRNQSTPWFCWFSGLSLLLLAIGISSVRLTTVQAQEPSPGKPTEVNVGDNGPTANINTKEADAKNVRGQIVNASGKPVANAKLWLPLQWKPRRTVEAVSDSTGRFELRCPADWISPKVTGSFWTVWVYAPGYSIQSQNVYEVIRGDSVKEYAIELPPESNTRFRVLTPDGQPLIGVQVKAQNYKARGYEIVPEEMQASLVARTDADGFVTLPAIQSGPLFSIAMQHEDYGLQVIRVDNKQAGAYREIRLRHVASIKGRLTSDTPEWVRNVSLAFTTDNEDEWKHPHGMAEVVTDNEGKFQIPKIASGGPLRTYVRIDPALPVRPLLSENVFFTADETVELEIPLVDAPLVRGKVVAKSTGKPVAKAEISLGYGGFQQSDQVMTDERGEYQGRVLPGRVRVHITSLPDGFVQLGSPWAEPYQVPENVDSFDLPKIEVVGSYELKGKLIGADDQPLPNIQVIAIEGNRRYGFGKSDAEGRFTLRVPHDVDTQITVFMEDRGSSPVQVIQKDPLVVKYVAHGSDKEMEAKRTLLPDVTLSGRILVAGEPIADVPVVLKRGVTVSLGSKELTGTRFDEVSKAKTDELGNYRLSGLKAGDDYQLEIDPPFPAADPKWRHQSPYIQKLPGSAQGEVVLPDMKLLKLTQSIAGIVVDPEGNPVKGATISVQLRTGEHLARLTSSGPPPWTVSDHQGRFQLKELPDEPLSITAHFANPKGGPIRSPAKLNVEKNQQNIRILLVPSLLEKEKR